MSSNSLSVVPLNDSWLLWQCKTRQACTAFATTDTDIDICILLQGVYSVKLTYRNIFHTPKNISWGTLIHFFNIILFFPPVCYVFSSAVKQLWCLLQNSPQNKETCNNAALYYGLTFFLNNPPMMIHSQKQTAEGNMVFDIYVQTVDKKSYSNRWIM